MKSFEASAWGHWTVGEPERTLYTNIAIWPDGTLRPWPGIGTTERPPVLRFDGQVYFLRRRK